MAYAHFAPLLPVSRFGLVIALAVTAGCQTQPEPGLTLKVSDAWRPVARSTWPTPGAPISAWSGPEGSSLVVYRALPIPRGTAEGIVAERVNRLRNLPGLEIKVERTETIAGRSAARVEVVAPGNGDDLAPSGVGVAVALKGKPLTPTRDVTIGFPRRTETLFLAFRTPEASYDRIAPEIQSILAGLALPPD